MTRLTVHVRHTDPKRMFYYTDAVKTFYYKNRGKEKVIGNEKSLAKFKEDTRSKVGSGREGNSMKIYSKVTKGKKRIRTTHTFMIESMVKDVVESHVENILSRLKSKGYQYSWKRSDGGIVDHWYLSNCYKCN